MNDTVFEICNVDANYKAPKNDPILEKAKKIHNLYANYKATKKEFDKFDRLYTELSKEYSEAKFEHNGYSNSKSLGKYLSSDEFVSHITYSYTRRERFMQRLDKMETKMKELIK